MFCLVKSSKLTKLFYRKQLSSYVIFICKQSIKPYMSKANLEIIWLHAAAVFVSNKFVFVQGYIIGLFIYVTREVFPPRIVLL